MESVPPIFYRFRFVMAIDESSQGGAPIVS